MSKRCYKNFDEAEFRQTVVELSWHDLYMFVDLNQAAQILTEKLTSVLDLLAPVKTIQTRTRYVPWLTPETKTAMKGRDAVQVNAPVSQHADDKNLRNTVTTRMRAEKSCWDKKKTGPCPEHVY